MAFQIIGDILLCHHRYVAYRHWLTDLAEQLMQGSGSASRRGASGRGLRCLGASVSLENLKMNVHSLVVNNSSV